MCSVWISALLLVSCLLCLLLSNCYEALVCAGVNVAVRSNVYKGAISLALTALDCNPFGVMDCTELYTVRCAVAFLVGPGRSNFVVSCLVVVVSNDLRHEECCSFEDVHCSCV